MWTAERGPRAAGCSVHAHAPAWPASALGIKPPRAAPPTALPKGLASGPRAGQTQDGQQRSLGPIPPLPAGPSSRRMSPTPAAARPQPQLAKFFSSGLLNLECACKSLGDLIKM